MSARRRLAHILIAHAGRALPPRRGDWAEAMACELEHVGNDRAALGWAIGCVLASYLERIRAMMTINRIGAIVPIAMSLLALSLVLAVATTGWERGLKDEGAAAHIFQLLVVGQLPFIAAYLITANWRRGVTVAVPIALQFGALALAIGAVAFFRL
jgi:hypothetical protein